jgi:uracil-DNA glycosylase family 4
MSEYVPGEGPGDANFAIVGEAPGSHEDRIGKPFVGPTGDLLEEMLSEVGVHRSEVYLTNVVKYQPPGNDIKKLPMMGIDLDKCVSDLWIELNAIKPNCILALGNTALKALSGKDGIQKWRGSVILGKDAKTKVIGTIHPAALLHSEGESQGGAMNFSARVYIIHDIKRAFEHSKYPDYRPPRRRLEIIRSAVSLARFFEFYRGHDTLSVDIEVLRAIPVCIGLSFHPNHGVSIPLLDVFSLQNKDGIHRHELAQMWRILAGQLARTDLKIIGQNFKFDHDKLERPCGFRIGNVRADLMLMMHTLYPELPKSLGFSTSIYTEEPYYKDEGKDFNFAKQKIDDLLTYNARDAAVTLEAAKKCLAEARSVEVNGFPDWFDNFYFGFVNRLHYFYKDMERVGLPINKKKRAELVKQYTKKVEDAQAAMNALAGFELNVNSPKAVAIYLYKELKFPERGEWMIGKNGNRYFKYHTDEETIVALAANHAKKDARKRSSCEQILTTRRLKKALGTYFLAVPDFDGRMRTSIRIAGAETGRTSNSLLKPPVRPSVEVTIGKKKKKRNIGLAFQTLTKFGDGAEVREIFEAEDGYEFIEIDQSQAEARVVALLGRDEATLSMFGRVDIHKLTASWIFGVPPDQINKELRFIGKTTRHAGNYGMRKRRLMFLVNTDAKRYGIDIEISEWRAGEILDKFHEFNPSIRQVFHYEVEQALLNNMMTLVNPFGRRRQFLGRWNDELLREAFAQIPQSTVADQTKKAGLEIVDKIPDAKNWLCLEAHDALLALVPKARREEYLKVAIPAFERPIDFVWCTLGRGPLTIPCEVKVGANYGALEELDIKGLRDVDRVA